MLMMKTLEWKYHRCIVLGMLDAFKKREQFDAPPSTSTILPESPMRSERRQPRRKHLMSYHISHNIVSNLCYSIPHFKYPVEDACIIIFNTSECNDKRSVRGKIKI